MSLVTHFKPKMSGKRGNIEISQLEEELSAFGEREEGRKKERMNEMLARFDMERIEIYTEPIDFNQPLVDNRRFILIPVNIGNQEICVSCYIKGIDQGNTHQVILFLSRRFRWILSGIDGAFVVKPFNLMKEYMCMETMFEEDLRINVHVANAEFKLNRSEIFKDDNGNALFNNHFSNYLVRYSIAALFTEIRRRELQLLYFKMFAGEPASYFEPPEKKQKTIEDEEQEGDKSN